ALHLHAYLRRDGPAAMLSSVFTGMGLHDRDSLADGSPPGPSLLRLYLEAWLRDVQFWGGAMGIEDGAHCWLCGRPLEQADRVTRVPNLGLFVHTSCHQIDLELTDDDSTDRRRSVD